jgi:hypothetical protein
MATQSVARGKCVMLIEALLVSPLDEFVLDGATKTVIGPAPCWVMMSH